MKKILFLIIALLMINTVLAQENKIYVTNLNFKDNELILKDISVQTGFYPDRKIQPSTGYKYELLSFDNQILDTFKFNIPQIVSEIPPLENDLFGNSGDVGLGILELQEVKFSLITKYFPNAKQINIYDPNNVKVLEIDVSKFSQQPSQPTSATSTTIQRQPSSSYTAIVIAVIALLGIIFYLIMKKRQKLIKKV